MSRVGETGGLVYLLWGNVSFWQEALAEKLGARCSTLLGAGPLYRRGHRLSVTPRSARATRARRRPQNIGDIRQLNSFGAPPRVSRHRAKVVPRTAPSL